MSFVTSADGDSDQRPPWGEDGRRGRSWAPTGRDMLFGVFSSLKGDLARGPKRDHFNFLL